MCEVIPYMEATTVCCGISHFAVLYHLYTAAL